jgi:hypothetical protein
MILEFPDFFPFIIDNQTQLFRKPIFSTLPMLFSKKFPDFFSFFW